MNLWHQNKAFVIICAALFVALAVVLRPSLIGRWSSPLATPVVVSFHRARYGSAASTIDELKPKFTKIFHPRGRALAVRDATRVAIRGNEVLLSNFREMQRWMSFIPRFPFRIPAPRKAADGGVAKDRKTTKGQEERDTLAKAYVSLAYTYARTGELYCDEYKLEETKGSLMFLTSTRNIPLGDPSFGMPDVDRPERVKDPNLTILKIALFHELGHLAILCGVDEIVAIRPGEPYTWRRNGAHVATVYPVDVHIKCDLPTLIRFVRALDGAHGEVTEVIPPKQAGQRRPTAAEPLPEAARPDDDDDDVADARRRPEPRETGATRLKIRLCGAPTIFPAEATQGALKERLTIFRHAKEGNDLEFIANAVITRIERRNTPSQGKGQEAKEAPEALPTIDIEAEVEPLSTVRFDKDGQRTHAQVLPGDYVSSRFYLVRSMRAQGVAEEVKLDKDGFPLDYTPRHHDVQIGAAALQIAEIQMPKVVEQRRKTRKPGPHRGW